MVMILKRKDPSLTNLDFDMPKINPQLLQKRRLSIVPLRPKRREPPRPKSSLFPHPSAHRGPKACASKATRSGTEASCARVSLAAVRWGAIAAVLRLRGCGVSGNGARGVGGGVELQVLG